MSIDRWLPLESNPDIMNKYIVTLGVKPSWQFVDVYGMDEELLLMIPRPACALLFLYPISDKTENLAHGEVVADSGLYFVRQTIHNACGTIAIIHALCNNADRLGFDMDKHMNKFLGDTKHLTPEERGKYLESDLAFNEVHENLANEGQTKAPPREDPLDLHFVAFVHHNGALYELDGRKDGPICHGGSSEDSLIEDSASVIKRVMANDPSNHNFTVVSLSHVE